MIQKVKLLMFQDDIEELSHWSKGRRSSLRAQRLNKRVEVRENLVPGEQKMYILHILYILSLGNI